VDFPAVMERVRGLIAGMVAAGTTPFEERGARVFNQEARIAGDHRVELADETRIEADRIVLSTGTDPAVPPVPGLEEGGFWTNKDAVDLDALPGSLAILGAGAVGVEFAQIFARFGVDVTLIEALDGVLPGEDPEISAALEEVLEAEGIRTMAGARMDRAERRGSGWELAMADGTEIKSDELLVATGRRQVLQVHDLDGAGVKVDERGNPVLTETLRTSNPNIWVTGDATGDLMFVHVNGHKADVVVDDILGRPHPVDYRIAPRVTFCEPEVASVGLTEDQAREEGIDVVTAVTRFEDDERSQIEGETAGLVKLVADERTGEVVGGHIMGEHAGEMIGEVLTAMATRTRPATIGWAIHPYPTRSQTLQGAFRALDR
jgi:pyruvate/2-oxoglutarate dehydrogenase complex dihydrolipoamide dehydrogenase (E3) component